MSSACVHTAQLSVVTDLLDLSASCRPAVRPAERSFRIGIGRLQALMGRILASNELTYVHRHPSLLFLPCHASTLTLHTRTRTREPPVRRLLRSRTFFSRPHITHVLPCFVSFVLFFDRLFIACALCGA